MSIIRVRIKSTVLKYFTKKKDKRTLRTQIILNVIDMIFIFNNQLLLI